MKNNLLNWLATALVIMLCIGLPSCSKDEEPSTTYETLILGEWFFSVDAVHGSEKSSIVYFKNDGSYEAKDYYDVAYNEEWDYPFTSISGKVSGTWKISGNKIIIKGDSHIAGEYIIDSLIENGCRLIRASHPDEYPYLIGGWHNR